METAERMEGRGSKPSALKIVPKIPGWRKNMGDGNDASHQTNNVDENQGGTTMLPPFAHRKGTIPSSINGYFAQQIPRSKETNSISVARKSAQVDSHDSQRNNPNNLHNDNNHSASSSTPRRSNSKTPPRKAKFFPIESFSSDSSTYSYHSGELSPLHNWNDDEENENEKQDPVGNIITEMLNEGTIPHFGSIHSRNNHVFQTKWAEGFQWSPLFSVRNFWASHQLALKVLEWIQHAWKRKDIHSVTAIQSAKRQTTEGDAIVQSKAAGAMSASWWFFVETFVLIYIVLLAICDTVIRQFSQFMVFTILGSISIIFIDPEEVMCAAFAVMDYLSNDITRSVMTSAAKVATSLYRKLEFHLLWGNLFQGRTIFWNDEDRLNHFRKRHLRLLKVKKEQRQNRKARRKLRSEQRKKEKRGISLDENEIRNREEENKVKEKVYARAFELRRMPPTYFPYRINLEENDNKGEEKELRHFRSEATTRHLGALQYCHNMVFRRDREYKQMQNKQQLESKPVSITMREGINSDDVGIPATSYGTSIIGSTVSALSPKEAIEVVDKFPNIGAAMGSTSPGQISFGESVSTVESTFSDQISSSSDLPDDADDQTELSYESEASPKTSMDWLTVGAKIGHKLLNSKEIHRVMANPDAKKLLPDEAKKLIQGIKNGEVEGESPSKASSWDGQNGDDTDKNCLAKSNSKEGSFLKPPVHRMWTSPGAAALTPPNNICSSVVNAPQPPAESNDATPKVHGKGKTLSSSSEEVFENLVSPNEESIEVLTRQSSPGSTKVLSPPRNPLMLARIGRGLDALQPSPLIQNKPSPSSMRPHRYRVEMSVSSSNTDAPSNVNRLSPLEKGVKIVVPMFPPNIVTIGNFKNNSCFFQMATVISSARICIPSKTKPKKDSWLTNHTHGKKQTNCLSIKVILDKALLRGSRFAEMTVRIMDEWNYTPRHSKFPIGSCVATTFGIGVLVGWRVEDDFHVIRALWNKSGPGTAVAYLQRDRIHRVVEAAVGFQVETRMGEGTVLAYVKGGKQNSHGKYFVKLNGNGRYRGRTMEFNRYQILSCRGATFTPVTEHIRAAAQYQLEILYYKAKLRENLLNNPNKSVRDKGMWRNFSEYVDLFATSFSKAIAEDPDFDREVDKCIAILINLLDGNNDSSKNRDDVSLSSECSNSIVETSEPNNRSTSSVSSDSASGWNIHDIFGCFLIDEKRLPSDESEKRQNFQAQTQAFEEAHDSAFVLVRVLLRTIAVARASVPNRPKLHIALAMIHESLLLIRQVLKVQKKNMSKKLIEAWFRTLHHFEVTFGPLKSRSAALWSKIRKKLRKHGDTAKKRILRFVDIVLSDTNLLRSLETGDWRQAVARFEVAIIKAKITDAETCEQLHRGILLMSKNLAPRKNDRKSKAAAARNGQKMVKFAKFMKFLASPGRSFLRVLTFDEVLNSFDKVLVRVFEKDPVCSMMINIYAFNFHSVRHLRTLNNMAIAGKLWATVLDAVDEELNDKVSEFPEQVKYFLEPLVKLFTLGVAKFHKIRAADSNADWLDFLMEDDAVKILQELDMKFIDCLDAFCKDVKQVFEVLPYIKTIENDILNLMDEFDFDLLVKELTDSIGDSEKFMSYLTERSAVIVERFLDYLPKMSIPIERRELQDGWVLTCRGKDGGDLRLSDISVKRDNLVCKVVGSDNVFSAIRMKHKPQIITTSPKSMHSATFESDTTVSADDAESVLDEIRELILSAQSHGCWNAGVGDLKEPSYFHGVPDTLRDLPLSECLRTGIDLWQSSITSDFDLLEMAIKEVSYQIKLQLEREEDGIDINATSRVSEPPRAKKILPSPKKKRFNPRVDPTVFFLEIKNLSLNLDEFTFRVEKDKPVTIFDPVFEGAGSLAIRNVSLIIKVEIRKERVVKRGHERPRPVLQLDKLDVQIERIRLSFKETGLDWILNQVLKGFRDQVTGIVQHNLKDQIVNQVHILLEHANGFIDANPEQLTKILGITMDDIEETIVSV